MPSFLRKRRSCDRLLKLPNSDKQYNRGIRVLNGISRHKANQLQQLNQDGDKMRHI